MRKGTESTRMAWKNISTTKMHFLNPPFMMVIDYFSLLLVVKNLFKWNKFLTTTPTVCAGQQFFCRLISIRLLCAQTEAAYRYWVSTRLETKDKGGEEKKKNTTINTCLFRGSPSPFRKHQEVMQAVHLHILLSENIHLIKRMPKQPGWSYSIKSRHIHASKTLKTDQLQYSGYWTL